MASDLFPFPPSGSYPSLKFRHWRSFLRSNGVLKFRFLSAAFSFTCLIFYLTPFSLHDPWGLPDWHLPSCFDPHSVPDSPSSSLQSLPVSGALTLEQIRNIVAPTRGFFSRDYSLHLGWNNMRYIIEPALLQAELLNRTLVLPSFLYSRACEYDVTVCADYATAVDWGEGIGSDEWRKLPIEQRTAFRIPISVIVNITHLRNRQPVITASEYLRLHGQDPESESTSGHWPRESYHTHPNVFEMNKRKTPSLLVIENHWYDPEGTHRVDYIPEAMKRRGNLERRPQPENYGGRTDYWPPPEPTEFSNRLASALPQYQYVMDWGTAKSVLKHSFDLSGEGNIDDDEAVEKILNAHGWEVLHTFQSVIGTDAAKTVVSPVKEVVQRLSIRGFRDDYYDVDADVVVLAGETHLGRKPGTMRFTEELARNKYANTVVNSLIPPQKVSDLADVLSSRMRQRTNGRMWMGAHMRRGDFVRFGWAMEFDPEAHIQRVKQRLQAGRAVLVDLHDRGNWMTCDIDGVQPDLELATLPPPHTEDPFFIATDERDPDAGRKITAAGAVFMSDLLTMEDRQTFGWSLMITDVMGIVEQQLLVRSSFFYGHGISSFAGAIVNMRGGCGADPRTMVLD